MRIRLFDPYILIFAIAPVVLFMVTFISYFDASNFIMLFIWSGLNIWFSGMFSFIEIKDDYLEHYGLPSVFYRGARTIMYEDIKNISGQHIVSMNELFYKKYHNWIIINNNNHICIGRFQILFSKTKLQRVITEIIRQCPDISVNQEINTFLKTGENSFKE